MRTPAEKALRYATQIIENYQMDIVEWGYDKKGFCQGTVYQHALETIKRIQEGKFDPDGGPTS